VPVDDVIPLEGDPVLSMPGDPDLERALEANNAEVVKASAALKKEMPDLILLKSGIMSVNQNNMRLLYQRTWDSVDSDDDDDNFDDDDESGWSPPGIIIKHIRAHFKKRPFDKVRMGILRIIDADGRLVWF